MRIGSTWNMKIARLTARYMHCSGYRVDHPFGLFSAVQRRVPPSKRVYIGHEGFVRLCNHQVITWPKIASIAMKLDVGGRNLSATVNFLQCKDNTHFPKHHGMNSPQVLDQQIGPCARIHRNSNNTASITLEWIGHLRLPDLGSDELRHDGQTTPNLLRRQVEQLRRDAAEFIAPEFPPGRLTEMNCFDPNRCSCLHFAGREQLPRGWQLVSSQGLRRPSCRKNLEHLLQALRPSQESARENSQARKERTGAHCVGVQTTSSSKNGTSRMVVFINPCAGESRCLQMKYIRRISIIPENGRPGRVTMAWFQALDPDSYNLTDDKESFGVLWCRQPGCRNYYRYLKRALVPFRDTHRECRKLCT
jgi:hypothetical protein